MALLLGLAAPASAQDYHQQTAQYLLNIFISGCLEHLGNPDAAIDWAITQQSFQPAPDNVSGDGLAWIDTEASGGVSFAVSTTTYHCAVAADGVSSEVASAYFGRLMFKLQDDSGLKGYLREVEIPGPDGQSLTQSFVTFPREDGNQTVLDIIRPTDLSQSGIARYAATVSLAD